MRSLRIILACLVGAMCLSAPTVGRAQSDIRIGGPVPDQVKQDWLDRRERCQTLHWKIRVRELITPGMFNTSQEQIQKIGLLPKEDTWRNRTSEAWIDFPKRSIRSEKYGESHFITEEGNVELIPRHDVKLFDGVVVQRFMANKENPRRPSEAVELMEGDTNSRFARGYFEACDVPLFWNVAILNFGGMSDEDFLNPKDVLKSAKVRAYDSDRRILTIRMPDRAESFGDFDLDLSMQSAIIRFVSYLRDGTQVKETIVKWEEQGGAWQPTSWSNSNFTGDGTLLISDECTVELLECSANFDDVVFHIEPKVGEKFYLASADENYVKAADGQPDIPLDVYQIQQNAQARRWRWITSIALFAGAVGFAAWWGRQKGVI